MPTHLAAILPSPGQPLIIQPRQTPTPGPGELLIAVKSIALNPADHIMRDTGLLIPPTAYPTILGFDLAGVIIQAGADVPSNPSKGENRFKPGTRIAAYAAHVFKGCHPNYGAFQEMCLVPWEHAIVLPDGVSFNEGASLPVSVQVPLSAWDAMKIPRVGSNELAETETKTKNQALLVWGASSSVGSMGVQSARVLARSPETPFCAVYATASSRNHEYIRSLGADRVFDYKEPGVVERIVSAARQDGLVIQHCFLAMGDITLCQDTLQGFLPADRRNDSQAKAKIASAPPIPETLQAVEGIETTFVMPAIDEKERLSQFEYWMGQWGGENLAKGAIRPSPEVRVVGRGLESVNAGLDMLREGVSCVKLVVEIAD